MEKEEKTARLDTIESLFSGTWAMYQERLAPLLRIVLLPVLVTVLGYTISDLRLPFSYTTGTIVLFAGWLLSVFNVLPLVFSIERGADIDDSYRATVPWILPFAWLMILEVLGVLGGFAMLFVPGIWIVFAFSFVSYVFVVEGRRGLDALRQSVEYVRGHWWAVTGRVMLMGIFVLLAAAVVQWVTTIFGGGPAAERIVAVLLTLFTTPFTAIFGYRIYLNLKSLKPELAAAPVPGRSGAGFVRVSVIVGALAIALLLLFIIFFSWHGAAHSFTEGFRRGMGW